MSDTYKDYCASTTICAYVDSFCGWDSEKVNIDCSNECSTYTDAGINQPTSNADLTGWIACYSGNCNTAKPELGPADSC